MYITAIHRPWRKLRGGICRYKTFWMRIFERITFLLLRCCSIHVKWCVLATLSLKVVAQTAMHSGNTHERQPNFRHRKKKENRKTERGEFITPPRPTGRQSKDDWGRISVRSVVWIQFTNTFKSDYCKTLDLYLYNHRDFLNRNVAL